MKRLHPYSATLRIVALALRTAATGFFLGAVLAGPLERDPFSLIVVLAPLGALAGAAWGLARYLRFRYDASGDQLAVASGVINRQERAIPFGRIQNVDVSQSLLRRALGLAVVRFETAGGSATEAVLDAVTLDEARRLQDRVAAHDRREETERSPEASKQAAGDTPDAAEATSSEGSRRGPTEELLYHLGLRDLFALGAVTARPAAPVLVVFTTPFLGDLAIRVLSATTAALGGPDTVAPELLPTYSTPELVIVLVVTLVEFALATALISAALTIIEFYDFRLTRVGDELRYERGLLSRYSGSIPVEKIQTVSVEETAPMRALDYAALSVETAGYAPGSNDRDATNTAVPLDDRETVVALAESLGEFEAPAVERPPSRARRRYAFRYGLLIAGLTAVLFAVDAFVFSFSQWYLPLLALPLAALAGHLKWVHRGHALADDAFIARSGFWRRSTRAVPYYRIQTVIAERSVFQRYRDLASVTADTASTASLLGGDATAHDVDEKTARRLHRELRRRLDEHRRERRGLAAGGSADRSD